METRGLKVFSLRFDDFNQGTWHLDVMEMSALKKAFVSLTPSAPNMILERWFVNGSHPLLTKPDLHHPVPFSSDSRNN